MALVLRDVSKTYRAKGTFVEALRGISLELPDGEILAVLGPSTSGKSTLINILGVLDRPTSGSYELDGVEIGKLSDRNLTRVRNQKIGLVFRSYHLLPRMPVIEEVELPLLYGSTRNPRAVAADALRAVGLADCMRLTLAELSPEQAPLVALARALVTEPSLLVFPDEAEFELDLAMVRQVWPFIEQLKLRRSVMMVLTPHSMEEAAACDRIAILSAGRLVAFDTQAALQARVGRDRIDLRTDDLPATLTALWVHLGISGQLVNGTIRMHASDGAELATRLRTTLTQTIQSIEIERTTIEDICRFSIWQANAGEPPDSHASFPA